MDEIDDATKKAVKAAIKQARAHLKNCDMILKGWVPDDCWPTRAKWKLSDELHHASECLWKAQEATFDKGTKGDGEPKGPETKYATTP
jgi:hypothetical protein